MGGLPSWWPFGRPRSAWQQLLPQVPPALSALLDGLGVPPQTPLRGEVFGLQRLVRHGRALGGLHQGALTPGPGPGHPLDPEGADPSAPLPAPSPPRRSTFFPRLRDNIRMLRLAQRYIASRDEAGADASPAAAWLLDNFHLIDAQLLAVQAALPRRYFRTLPLLRGLPLAGLPRIYAVAWDFVVHADSAFDEELLVPYLQAYQQAGELRLGEMWALPTTLRVVLVENLRRLAEQVAAHDAVRELAGLCATHAATLRPAQLQGLHALLAARGLAAAFATELALCLPDTEGVDGTGEEPETPRPGEGKAAADAGPGPTSRPDHGPDPAAADAPGASLARLHAWLDHLAPAPLRARQAAQRSADETADNLSVSNAVTSLRTLGDADWAEIVARASPLMGLMLQSPLFAAEHPGTRDQTLHGIERLARRARCSEGAVARALLALMGGAGAPEAGPADPPDRPGAVASHWLQGPGTPALRRALGLAPLRWPGAARALQQARLPLYLAAAGAATLALVAALLGAPPGVATEVMAGAAAGSTAWGSLAGWVAMALLMTVIAAEAVTAVLQRMVVESARPRLLPRLALTAGIPAAHRVLVVIPALLTDLPGLTRLAHGLRRHALANPEPMAQFALLTDWADADGPQAAGDAALLAAALQAIDQLNAPADDSPPALVTAQPPASGAPRRFLLLHRARQPSPTEGRWIGWERKRGKLEQLLAWIVDSDAAPSGAPPGDGPAPASPFLELGASSQLAPGIRHVLTLDSDTLLPPGALRHLVGVAAHPQNRPRLAADDARVTAGYAILQPRLATPLPAAGTRTPFHWLFSGHCGLDAYSAASSELHQDFFLEASFSGKGLLDVAAVHAVLGGRLPPGTVLSHDLLEGALARCGAVSDLVLVEDAPGHPDAAAARSHRWMRGDWQLLPFLLRPGRWPLGAVNRWKMATNLRRSLVAPASLGVLLLAAAGVSPGLPVALALVAAAYGAGPLLGALAGFVPSSRALAWGHFLPQAGLDLARALGGLLWQLALLPQQAALALDAVARTLWRLAVSRRHLLQWTTAAASQAAAASGLPGLLRRHGAVPLAVALGAALLWAWGPVPTPASLAVAALLAAAWVASPLLVWWGGRAPRARGGAAVLADLGRVDVAGLRLLARDTWRYFERVVSAADHHLPPDNLQSVPEPMLARRTSPTNIGLYLLSTACARRFGFIGTAEMLARLQATTATLEQMPRHHGHLPNWIDTATAQPLLPQYVSTVDSGNLSGHLLATAQACRELARCGTGADALAWPAVVADLAPDPAGNPAANPAGHPAEDAHHLALHALAARLDALAWAPDFRFLYHPRRHLLHIGWRVAEQQLDAGFYDLLASESRLTSLIAIARGDVPVAHWAALGRPFHAVGRRAALRSWSGSMFEYLMPTLVLAEPPGSALAQAHRAALREQMDFAVARGVPWGISESAYAGCDHTLAYQYAPQGVPRLALRRTPPGELVVAPYATLLALLVDPAAAVRNLAALQRLGARDGVPGVGLGFIEALDFSPSRQAPGVHMTPVHTAMAHHQGMGLVALANLLLDGAPQRWGAANPHLEAVALLLHERGPREVMPLSLPHPAPPRASDALGAAPLRELQPGQLGLAPTLLLSNGRLHTRLRPSGAGSLQRGSAGITRWRDDALRDAWGSFFFLRFVGTSADTPGADDRSAPLVSLTQHPAPDAAARYSALFHPDRAQLDATWPGLHSRVTVWVSPEDDCEFRQVELQNLGDAPLVLDLVSQFEPTLADPRADEAHPAFSQMFLSAAWRPAAQALLFERRPRLQGEPALHMAHFIAECDPPLPAAQPLRGEVDRARWQGRGRSAGRPLGALQGLPAATAAAAVGASGLAAHGLGHGAPPDTRLDTGLDPVCALGLQLQLAPGARLRLVFATAVADDAGTLDAILDKHRQPLHVQRALLMAATLAGVRRRALGLDADTLAAVQSLSTALLLTLARRPLRTRWPASPWPAPGTRLAPLDAAAGAGAAAGVGAGAAAQAAAPLPSWPACNRRLLWRLGVSGDLPILLVHLSGVPGLALVRSLVQALRLWAWAGVACDLVVVNAEATSYLMPVQRELAALRDRLQAEQAGGALAGAGPAGVARLHVVAASELSEDESLTLRRLARVRFTGDGRSLALQVQAWAAWHQAALRARNAVPGVPWLQAPPLRPGAPDPVFAGDGEGAPFGGRFSADGASFDFTVGAGRRPLKPWINVLANPGFGSLLSESGGGCSWALNSRLHQLTAWSNDAVADPPGEWLALQDAATGQTWGLTAATGTAGAGDALRYHVTHTQGRTDIRHRRGDIEVHASWCVDPVHAVRQLHLRISSPRPQRLRLALLLEWLLGMARAERASVRTAQQPVPGFPGLPGVPLLLLATQCEQSAGFGGSTAFVAVGTPAGAAPEGEADAATEWTCDRRELLDAEGAMRLPQRLGRGQGEGGDPCAALVLPLVLQPGVVCERVVLLGWAPDPAAASALAQAALAVPPRQRLQAVATQWDGLLGATTVATPDPLFDALVNRWLLYQAVSCRLWAKAGFYQAGGATGFRDQLQDTLALAWAQPGLLRAQLLLCASRQFPEGDVQHWWHAPGGAGVRTHFSDDLLWLPHACAHYLRRTGDAAVLDEAVPFLQGDPVPPGAEDLYATPQPGPEAATLYEHAARAIDHSLRTGVHGLPLMGSGDWNDGMNRVGIGGRGESVWLAWFLCKLVADFAPVAQARGDVDRAARWRQAAAGWQAALQGPAWDGAWYRRAFFDDGTPLGSAANAEARIDLIAQAWAVLSGAAPPERQRQAMASARAELVDADAGLVRLLHPPLQHAQPSAGYIQAYPPGVRENGGQYTHGGVWALMATAALVVRHGADGSADGAVNPAKDAAKDGGATADEVWRLFTGLSPAHRAAHPQRGPVYGIEPYAVAGDICSQPPHTGRGGWSWYTGAASWLHRAAVESMFGLDLQAQSLVLHPCLPGHWPRAEITLRRGPMVLRFVCVQAAPLQALALAAEPGATLLHPGGVLHLAGLGTGGVFVVPLQTG